MPHKDPAMRKAYAKKYRQRRKLLHAERDAIYNRAWVRANPSKIATAQLRWKKRNPAAFLLSRARNRARSLGLPSDITTKDIVIPTHCPVLRMQLQIGLGGPRGLSTISLDRIIPSLGYVPGNVRVISWRANNLKNDATLEELILLGKDARRIQNGK